MIHTTILETCPETGEERAKINHALMGTTPAPAMPSGPVRYAKPGEITRQLDTVPVNEAIAALGARMPGVPNLGR